MTRMRRMLANQTRIESAVIRRIRVIRIPIEPEESRMRYRKS